MLALMRKLLHRRHLIERTPPESDFDFSDPVWDVFYGPTHDEVDRKRQ